MIVMIHTTHLMIRLHPVSLIYFKESNTYRIKSQSTLIPASLVVLYRHKEAASLGPSVSIRSYRRTDVT